MFNLYNFLFKKRPTSKATAPIDFENRDPDNVIHSKVVGVTFSNDDGTSRQIAIRCCREGDQLLLKHMPTKKNPEALGVFTVQGRQLGYLRKELAMDLLSGVGKFNALVLVENITGGSDGKETLGCNVQIKIYEL